MLKELKAEANLTLTENGAVTHRSTLSHCLDLFAVIGAIRQAPEEEIISLFKKAYRENRTLAMKILFFARDVRGGLGERRVFRVIANYLAQHEPETLRKNMGLIPEYGRFDDLVPSWGLLAKRMLCRSSGNSSKRTWKEENPLFLPSGSLL